MPAPHRQPEAPLSPRRHQDGVVVWLALLGLLGAAAVPLVVRLDRASLFDPLEAEAVATSVETWRNRSGPPLPDAADAGWSAGVAPMAGAFTGVAAPGPTWLHLIALRLAGVDEPEDLVVPVRLVSVVAGLVAVGAVYWIGLSLGGLTVGLLAGAVLLSHPMFIYHARSGTGVVPLLAWVTLAIAAGGWSLRPLSANVGVWRQGLGWGACGVALAGGVLTGGWVAVPLAVGPLVLAALLTPGRKSQVLGPVASAGLATLLVMPWLVASYGGTGAEAAEPAVGGWLAWSPAGPGPSMAAVGGGYFKGLWDRVVWLLVAGGVWGMWLVAGAVLPWSEGAKPQRRRLLIGWGWLGAAGAVVAFWPSRSTGQGAGAAAGVLVLPAVAAVVGQLFAVFAVRADQGRPPRLWSVLRHPMLAGVLALSLLVPAAGLFWRDTPALNHAWALPGQALVPMHPAFWTGVAATLVTIALLGLRWALQNHPGRSLMAWSLWLLVLTTLLLIPVTAGPLMQRERAAESRRIQRSLDPPPRNPLPLAFPAAYSGVLP